MPTQLFYGYDLFSEKEIAEYVEISAKRVQHKTDFKRRPHKYTALFTDIMGYIGERVFCKLYPSATHIEGGSFQCAKNGTDMGDVNYNGMIVDVKCSVVEPHMNPNTYGFLVRGGKFSVREINERVVDSDFTRHVTHISNIIIQEPFTRDDDKAIEYFLRATYSCAGIVSMSEIIKSGKIQMEHTSFLKTTLFTLPCSSSEQVAYIRLARIPDWKIETPIKFHFDEEPSVIIKKRHFEKTYIEKTHVMNGLTLPIVGNCLKIKT